MTKFIRIARAFSALLLLCLLALPVASAQSQASTGQIAGSVRDAVGALVPNAAVSISNPQTGFSATMASGAEGLFQVPLLPAGNYVVKASAPGFAEAIANDVAVEVGRTATLNIRLQVGKVEQTIEVTAEAIQVEQSHPDTFVNSQAISDLPIF